MEGPGNVCETVQMAADKPSNTEFVETLLPVLATELLSQFQRQLRLLAENLEKKRGQPPKTSLAAAKYLYQTVGDAAVRASDQSDVGTTPPASTGIPTSGKVDVDEVSEQAISDRIEQLGEWLTEGTWWPFEGEVDSLPPLLTVVEEAAGRLRSQTSEEVPEQTVTELLENFRGVLNWAESFVVQRQEDQAARDDLVLLTVARLNLVTQPQSGRRPTVTAARILNHPTDRLPPDWGDESAYGVSTYSKGHFGNDQAAFNDACRAFVVDLLDRAAQKPSTKTIYVSTSIFQQSNGKLRAEFDQKITECLAAGWRVVHVLGRGISDDATDRVRMQVDFATNLLADLRTKGIYVPISSVPEHTTDMVLVDGIGAIMFPSIGNGPTRAAGSGRTGGSASPALAIRAITGRGGTGDGPAATPIVSELRAEAKAVYGEAEQLDSYLDKRVLPYGFRLPTENLLWFDRQLSASELLEGDRYVLRLYLPTSTMPDHLSVRQFESWSYQLHRLLDGDPDTDGLVRGWPDHRIEAASEYLQRIGTDELDLALRRLENKRSVRHFSFQINTMKYRYRDCVLEEWVERYMVEEDPWYSVNAPYGPAGMVLEDRHEHMLFVAQQLEQRRVNLERGEWAGYSLGLIGEDQGQPYDITKTGWLVTQSPDRRADQVHYLHIPAKSAATYVATLREDSIHRFDAVSTFMSLFDGVWFTIHVQNRYPETVIEFILERLPAEVRARFKRIEPLGVAR